MSSPKASAADTKSLDAILEDFSPAAGSQKRPNIRGGTVTIWLSPDYKARFDRLQHQSGRGFSKKVRELIQAAIDRFEPDAA